MGNWFGKGIALSAEDLNVYTEATFLTRSEIIKAWNTFNAIAQKVDSSTIRTEHLINNIAQIKYNPFAERIAKMFCHRGHVLEFIDFLEMVNVFSPACPKDVKAEFAFRMYDFSNSGFIDPVDVRRIVKLLARPALTKEETDEVVRSVFEEMDVDGDKQLSLSEFKAVIETQPHFAELFTMRLV